VSRGAALLVLGALAGTCAGVPARADGPRRFALVVGEPDGGPGAIRLRYAERDARRIHAILTRVGGVRPEDARLLHTTGASAFLSALAELSARAEAARAQGVSTVLLVYYSGHAADGALRLGPERIPFEQLRLALERAPADVRIGLLDSCRSGAIARAKGVRPAPAFDVSRPAGDAPRGLVLIASSAADEDSQESDAIGASWFTHHLASGLLGGADSSGDGKVTLSEAYAYAYARTVGSTASSAGGVQHPVFLYDLGGAGDLIMADLTPHAGGLVLGPASEGLYVVLDGGGRAVAEVAKGAGDVRRVALPAGRYVVKKRLPDESGVLVAPVVLGAAPLRLEDAQMERQPLARDPQKGFGGARWSLLSSVGGQRFFDRAARDGLFPPAALAGAEVTVRDDLGHGLGWGLDLALGGGAGTVRLDAEASVPVKFAALSGGASLWEEVALGPISLSGGVRIGVTYLARSFPAREQLPAQRFFTFAPGLVGGAALRLTPRLSAVGRVRISYLRYNVDRNQNLGFLEGTVGIDYALGE
jgi:uncharacterized caspase-like protein